MEVMNNMAQVVAEMQQTGLMTGLTGTNGIRGFGGRGSVPGIGDDGFAQLFLQLMNLLGDAGDDPDTALWMPDPAQDPTDRKTGRWEMLMALMDMAPRQMDFRQFALTDPGGGIALDFGALREISLSAADSGGESHRTQLAALVDMFLAEATGEEQEQVPELFVQAAMATPMWEAQEKPPEAVDRKAGLPTQKAATAPPEGPRLGEDDLKMPLTVLGYQATDKADTGDGLYTGAEQFRQAVQEAKSRLPDKGGKTGPAPGEAIPADSVMKMLAGGVVRQEPQSVEAPGIPEQILVGLSRNLSAGKGEFVLKLVPEGLGEITVKLLAKEGRTTLRIITASAETARLINNDLAALQNALRPIRVEVHEAVPGTESGKEANVFAGYDQLEQFNQFNQFGNRGEPDGSAGRSRNNGIVDELGEIDGADAVQTARMILTESELDMYV